MSATLGGSPVLRARVQVPAWGIWWADVDLAEAIDLVGLVTLEIGGLALSGYIMSGGPSEGRAAYRVVGGSGGWGTNLSARAYSNDGGVKASTVITDAASDVAETLVDPPTTRLGPHYTRPSGPASAVLDVVAERAWYVDFEGSTCFGARSSTEYDGPGTILPGSSPAFGVVEIAAEDLSGLVPGVTIGGGDPAVDVEYDLTESRLTARLYLGARTSRRVDALARLVDALDPRRIFRGTYEFRVVSQIGDRLNLQPARASSGMPSFARVPVRGAPGVRATVALGELVLVTFADADPSRPCVIAHDAPDAPGWMPIALELGDAPTLGIARKTDAVTISAGITVSVDPNTGIGATTSAGAGTITGGSARVLAGL